MHRYLDLTRPVTLLLAPPPGSPQLRQILETSLPGTRLVHAPGWAGTSESGPERFLGYLPAADLVRLISAADGCRYAELEVA